MRFVKFMESCMRINIIDINICGDRMHLTDLRHFFMVGICEGFVQ